ncbi:alpha/beta hydrolase [Bosea sp. F3-2]|uniref:alpha/beta hydrolase n=1 Tax=Bosea sp. F3-2 TaxID=2599640 RepID=UPI001656449F|nr:alpha/beta hydrolase [Bosea sp. F3-2]
MSLSAGGSRSSIREETKMPLNEHVAIMLDSPRAKFARPLHELTIAEARGEAEKLASLQGEPAEIAFVSNRYIDRPGGAIRVRLYKHRDEATAEPVLIYFHGGGFMIGSLDSFDRVCRRIAATSGCAVLSVDYRLSPEHPYPAATDDAWTVTQWLAREGGRWGLDPGRLAVAGDSAGATLAASVTQAARKAGSPAIRHQALIYPALDLTTRVYPSKIDNAEGYRLTMAAVEWFYGHYLPDRERASEIAASPLLTDDFANLPPATVLTAEFDPLRDEGDAYAAALAAAGVPVEHIRMEGMIHGFLGFFAQVPQCVEVLDRMALSIKAALTA